MKHFSNQGNKMNKNEQEALAAWDVAAYGLLERINEFQAAVDDDDVLLAERILGMLSNDVEQCLALAVWRAEE